MRKIHLLLLTLVLFSSCQFIFREKIRGNGHITTEQKNIGDFSSIELRGAMNVHLKQASGNDLKIETDDNLLPYIEVYTEGDKLIVREKKGYNLRPTRDINVYASAPVFRAIRLSGSGDILSDNTISGNESLDVSLSGSGGMKLEVDLPKITSHVSGSGDISLKGEARDADLSLSGSGSVRCMDLVSDNVSLQVSGSGDAGVTANKTLDVRISGSGSVAYRGNPSVTQKISGSGDVRRVN